MQNPERPRVNKRKIARNSLLVAASLCGSFIAGRHFEKQKGDIPVDRRNCATDIYWNPDGVRITILKTQYLWPEEPDQWIHIGLQPDGMLCVDQSDPSTGHKRPLPPEPYISLIRSCGSRYPIVHQMFSPMTELNREQYLNREK